MPVTMRPLLWALAVSGIVWGCATAPHHPTLRRVGTPKLISADLFYRSDFSRIDFQVSPDGQKLAWASRRKGNVRILCKTIGLDNAESIYSGPGGAEIIAYRWLPDSERVIFSIKAGAGENAHVYLADIRIPGKAPVDLTPLGQGDARLQRIIVTDPLRVLVERRSKPKGGFDLFEVDVQSLQSELLAENPGNVKCWLTDPSGDLRGRVRMMATGRWSLELRQRRPTFWWELLSWSIDDSVKILGFTPDGAGLWMLSNRGRDRVALVRLELADAQEQIVYQDPLADVQTVLISPATRMPLAAYSYPDYPRIHYFDTKLESDLRALGRRAHSGIYLSSMDGAERLFALSVYHDRGADFYLYERDSGKKYLFYSTPISLYADQLATVRPIALEARDGFPLKGYLTLPHRLPGKNLPMVLLVHGGPWSRDYWHYDSTVQFLANRGYAVLQVNFRGSEGYGRAYMEAAIGEFAGKMHTDLIDAVRWAIDAGIADPKHIGIVGASYGGYAALVGMSFTPGVFACGVSLAGPSELAALVNSFPDNWNRSIWHRYLGDPAEGPDEKQMKARSPVYRAAKVRGPLLILHGAKDTRVKIQQSDKIVTALRKAGKPVDYVVFAEEGHSLHGWNNISTYFEKLEKFLSTHLGGAGSGI